MDWISFSLLHMANFLFWVRKAVFEGLAAIENFYGCPTVLYLLSVFSPWLPLSTLYLRVCPVLSFLLFFLSTRIFWLDKLPASLKAFWSPSTWKIRTAALREPLWWLQLLCSFLLCLWSGNTGGQVYGMSTFSSILLIRKLPGLPWLGLCLTDSSPISPLSDSTHASLVRFQV